MLAMPPLAVFAALDIALATAARAECTLASYRDRVDRTLASITVETRSETALTDSANRPWVRVDIGFSGSIDGCVVLDGPIPRLKQDYSWLYDFPDLTLAQEHLLPHPAAQPYPLPLKAGDGNVSPPIYATGRFEAKDGAGITFLLPKERPHWNGKLFIVQRGSGSYVKLGPLIARGDDALAAAGSGKNLYAEGLIDRGYAVAYFVKDAIRPPLGVSKATTADGKVLTTTYVAHVGLVVAMTEFAQRFVAETLGEPPRRTLYYGHSGGGISGRLVNYAPGANTRGDGQPVIDGFIDDDAGNGLYLPILLKEGKDVLFATAESRRAFAPQIDVTRQLYNPLSYRAAKYLNAALLAQKGLGDRHRHYELRGLSHFDSGMTEQPGSNEALDLAPFFLALADRLDAWVDRGAAPPANRADTQGADPAISLPEVACPLGHYYAPPDRNGAFTRFAAFDGATPEPEVAPGRSVDMNGNGGRDAAETVTAAWRRLGLAKDGPVTAERYAECLASAARRLEVDGFLPASAGEWYRRHALRLLEKSGARLQ
jgi:hypothetical protein